MLAIEVDGDYHYFEETRLKDKKRQDSIEALGISFLRFSNDIIKHDMLTALNDIHQYIDNFELKNKLPTTR